MVFTTTIGKYVFTPTVPNKEKIIAKDKINGKELFPQNTVIEYALFNVILEHDADGPYKVHL